jgi:hypothetical protein
VPFDTRCRSRRQTKAPLTDTPLLTFGEVGLWKPLTHGPRRTQLSACRNCNQTMPATDKSQEHDTQKTYYLLQCRDLQPKRGAYANCVPMDMVIHSRTKSGLRPISHRHLSSTDLAVCDHTKMCETCASLRDKRVRTLVLSKGIGESRAGVQAIKLVGVAGGPAPPSGARDRIID